MSCETEEEIARICLDVVEELSGSKYGFFGEINENGRFDSSVSTLGWDACTGPDAEAGRLLRDMEIRGFHFSPLQTGESIIVNEPSSHPESMGTPEGHPEITAFIGIPLKQLSSTFGMFGLANREGGYTPIIQSMLEDLSVAIAEATHRKRAEIAHARAEESLIRAEKLAVLGKLAGGVGHELRNPLGAIKNASYFLKIALENPESDVKETLEIIEHEVSNSEKIISNLLDFARAKPPSKKSVNVNDRLVRRSPDELFHPVSKLQEKSTRCCPL